MSKWASAWPTKATGSVRRKGEAPPARYAGRPATLGNVYDEGWRLPRASRISSANWLNPGRRKFSHGKALSLDCTFQFAPHSSLLRRLWLQHDTDPASHAACRHTFHLLSRLQGWRERQRHRSQSLECTKQCERPPIYRRRPDPAPTRDHLQRHSQAQRVRFQHCAYHGRCLRHRAATHYRWRHE